MVDLGREEKVAKLKKDPLVRSCVERMVGGESSTASEHAPGRATLLYLECSKYAFSVLLP